MRKKRWVAASVSVSVVAGAMALVSVEAPAAGPLALVSARSSTPSTASLVARLTPRQLAGQRVIYSYPGATPPAALLRRISSGEAAGVIFFGENIKSLDQIHAVVRQLEAAAKKSPVHLPLLLMTDQEGGKVRRLPGAPLLSEKQIGASKDGVSLARQAGTGAGDNLRGVGMDVNLAPVLDVFRQPGNFIDEFGRSYSNNPRTVAKLGRAFITAHQKTGVAATTKHFPGLGAAATAENTDLTPVTLHIPLSQLRKVDEAPYTDAIRAKVKLVMTSWAVYPALDKNRPAGLSRTIVQRELRGRDGFRGVTITDALEAGALKAYGGTGNRAVLAAGAGMDLLLASARDVAAGDQAADGLAAAFKNGHLNKAEFMQAVQRLIALRKTLTSN